MIHISDEAARKVASLMAEQGQSPDKAFVRVAVKSGGCSGLSYDLDFVDNESEGDQAFEAKGVTILAEKKSLLYLIGTTLEYQGGLNGKGFQFNNPNASRTCGCGESFTV
ncbi:MAG: iron-sulfur cluster assembly accessory protein [Schleiferiaceae bacterium]|jgi:iron-sulfur cluster assembly protein|nr:iron-sulfur cluster assembly accessory protein [Flavobacteriales bacterium]MDG1006061.1 iron-sulfur cluster assembly accessory protein [Schleiferiaceae bacterium]MBT3571883.1 iron-sulfur cluster assembly accessory protein [Flavobacteriales bacterium]MBT3678016.1 iron-sulfur cluster assembly accessory protein [Flavobacteriales bacterium]MBT3739492.1 iron-sulfur cluster assembly accessory protein [Flavobacteriales bacterium]